MARFTTKKVRQEQPRFNQKLLVMESIKLKTSKAMTIDIVIQITIWEDLRETIKFSLSLYLSKRNSKYLKNPKNKNIVGMIIK